VKGACEASVERYEGGVRRRTQEGQCHFHYVSECDFAEGSGRPTDTKFTCIRVILLRNVYGYVSLDKVQSEGIKKIMLIISVKILGVSKF
jgi:hypothetical protein